MDGEYTSLLELIGRSNHPEVLGQLAIDTLKKSIDVQEQGYRAMVEELKDAYTGLLELSLDHAVALVDTSSENPIKVLLRNMYQEHDREIARKMVIIQNIEKAVAQSRKERDN